MSRSKTGKDHYTLALDQYKRRDWLAVVKSIDKVRPHNPSAAFIIVTD